MSFTHNKSDLLLGVLFMKISAKKVWWLLFFMQIAVAAEPTVVHGIINEDTNTLSTIEKTVKAVEHGASQELLHLPVARSINPSSHEEVMVHSAHQAPLILEWLTQKPASRLMTLEEIVQRANLIERMVAAGADPNRYTNHAPLENMINFPHVVLRRKVLSCLLERGAYVCDPNQNKGICSVILGRLQNCKKILSAPRTSNKKSQWGIDHDNQLKRDAAFTEIKNWMEDIPMLVEFGVDPFFGEQNIYQFLVESKIPYSVAALRKARNIWRGKITPLLLAGASIKKNPKSLLSTLPPEVFKLIYRAIFEADQQLAVVQDVAIQSN